MPAKTFELHHPVEPESINFDDLALVSLIGTQLDTLTEDDKASLRDNLGQDRLDLVRGILDRKWTGEELGSAYARSVEEHISGLDQSDPFAQAYASLDRFGLEAERGIEYLLKKSLGDDTESRTLSPEYMAERKRFVEAVVAHVDTMPRGEKSSAFARQFYEDLCSHSPNILDYVGGSAASVELASTISSIPEFADIYRGKLGGIVYDLAFTRDPEAIGEHLASSLKEASVDQQLRMLRVFHSINRYAEYEGYDTTNAILVIKSAIEQTDSSSVNGLTDRVAIYVLNESLAILRGGSEHNMDDMEGVGRDLSHYEQTKLQPIIEFRDGYQGTHTPSRIARNLIGARDRWGVITAVAEVDDAVLDGRIPTEADSVLLYISQHLDRAGNFVGTGDTIRSYLSSWYKDEQKLDEILLQLHSLATYEQRKEFIDVLRTHMENPAEPIELSPVPITDYLEAAGIDLTDEERRTFQELHRPKVRAYMQWQLGGINFEDFDIQSQIRLFNFAANANQKEFHRLLDAADTIRSEDKSEFIDSFLALEFGEEFGEVLLDIAEKAESHERKELLSSILDLRRYAKSFGAAFSEYNPEFGKSIETASIKRITEALIVVDALLKGETPEATLYNGETIAVVDLSEVTEALRLLKAGYASLEQTLSGSFDEVKKEAHGEQIVIHPTIPGSQVQLRKYGGERYPDVGFDGEARINFLFSTNHKDIPLDVSNPQREQALSIRIDREGIIRDSDGNFVSTDPTIRQGSVSLDIGSIYGEKDNPNVKVGRILALGNALINAKRGKKPMFNHIREAFSPRYGDSETFARIVAYLEQKLA